MVKKGWVVPNNSKQDQEHTFFLPPKGQTASSNHAKQTDGRAIEAFNLTSRVTRTYPEGLAVCRDKPAYAHEPRDPGLLLFGPKTEMNPDPMRLG